MADHPHLDRAAERENVDPEERMVPMPLAPALLLVGMIIWGIVYIVIYPSLDNARFGDLRTVSSLEAKGAAASDAPVDGKALFAAHCAACHQASGTGISGAFPPLDGSDWVQGNPKVLANIMLHGIEGELEVHGQTFNGSMPSFERLPDNELAGLASYIRSAWGNQAEVVESDVFKAERERGHEGPFDGGAELEKLKQELG